MFNFLRILLAGLVLFSCGAFANNYIAPEYFIGDRHSSGRYSSYSEAIESEITGWKNLNPSYASCATFGAIYYDKPSGKWGAVIGGCAGGGVAASARCSAGSTFDNNKGMCAVSECPAGTEPNANNECVPPPRDCEAGDEVSANKFFPSAYISTTPATLCVLSCKYDRKSIDQCAGPYVQGNVVGSSCRVTYSGTGDECDGGEAMPPGDPDAPPDTPQNPDCRVFVNADGSHGIDCNPRPDPEDNSCPAGYMLQGNTCFRVPPEHPDYNPDKDPNKPPTEGGGDGEGTGDDKGLAKDSSLKDIGTKIDTTNTKLTGIDGKVGTSNTLLQGIIDAIGKIPGGGGGGTKPGDGEEDGECKGAGCEYDESAEWTDAEAHAVGSKTGEDITVQLNTSIDQLKEEREGELTGLLEAVPAQITEIFGNTGQKIPGINLIDQVLPSSQGCSLVTFDIPLGQYRSQMKLDVCLISRIKPLLEWVIYCLTGIAIWRTFYSGLRLQDAAHAKKGY